MSELQRAPLCYLATPYSKYPSGIDAAFIEAARITGELIKSSIKVYSPIVHCHPASVHGNIPPLDHSIWLPFDEAMMQACAVLIVAQMAGWHESFGVAHEIDFFERRGRPIYDLNPERMSLARRVRKLARDRFEDKTSADLEPDRREFLQNNPPAEKSA